MVQMVEMTKDLHQQIRLLKEGRTQEIRDNTPPLVNQERVQPEGGSVVKGGANPQYLTLVDVNVLVQHSGVPKQFS